MKYWKKGLLLGIALLVIGLLLLVVDVSIGYNGKCGGLFPSLSGPYDCSFIDYLPRNLTFSLSIILKFYWWTIPLLIITPTLIGYIIDKDKK